MIIKKRAVLYCCYEAHEAAVVVIVLSGDGHIICSDAGKGKCFECVCIRSTESDKYSQ